ncbi:MAG: hypothetical protein RJA63_61 [Pseudomonadota bacterium]|jgi:hypothetical protein
MTDATKLAESLRAMRRNARNHWALQREGRYSITMDSTRLGDLSDAADLIERQASELAEWRSVFGHLGKTPDDCGNAIGEARKELEAEIKALKEAPAVLLTYEQCVGIERAYKGNELQGLMIAVEAASLAANGKAVP